MEQDVHARRTLLERAPQEPAHDVGTGTQPGEVGPFRFRCRGGRKQESHEVLVVLDIGQHGMRQPCRNAVGNALPGPAAFIVLQEARGPQPGHGPKRRPDRHLIDRRLIGRRELRDQERQGHILRLERAVDHMPEQVEALIAREELEDPGLGSGKAEMPADPLRILPERIVVAVAEAAAERVQEAAHLPPPDRARPGPRSLRAADIRQMFDPARHLLGDPAPGTEADREGGDEVEREVLVRGHALSPFSRRA